MVTVTWNSPAEMTDHFAIITCHFNPAGYRKTRENFHVFRASIGRPVLAIEASFDGTFHCATESNDVRIVADPERHTLWQKERLLNLLIYRLPATVTKVAWIDADIVFCNRHWFEQADALLDHYPIVQLFRSAEWMRDGRSRESWAHAWVTTGKPSLKLHHPGFAWAARVDALPRFGDRFGLYDRESCGSADVGMAHAFSTGLQARVTPSGGPGWFRDWQAWESRVTSGMGCVPGHVKHLYHGSRAHREYFERQKLMRLHAFDPVEDLAIDDNGLLVWTGHAHQEMVEHIRGYFARRQEDS